MVDTQLDAIEVNDSMVEDGLRSACSSGDAELIKSILSACTEEEKGQLLHKPSITGPPIFAAIIADRADIVGLLVDQGYKLELEFDVNIFYPVIFRDKSTALCVACGCGHVKIVEVLLNKGASVNHCSHFSSPLLYACEYDNSDLVSLLLKHGADLQAIPQGRQINHHPVLPLYQACLQGHRAIAELLLSRADGLLTAEKKLCLLALLGAQCVNLHQDYSSGINYWKQGLAELDILRQERLIDVQDLAVELQGLYLQESVENINASTLSSDAFHRVENFLDFGAYQNAGLSTSNCPQPVNASLKHRHSVFQGMQLATSLEELEAMEGNTSVLDLQALLVLENLLGPCHPDTTQQVSRAARDALESQHLSLACKLFLYIIESTEKRNKPEMASSFSSQLADLLLNVYSNAPHNLTSMEDFTEILLAAIELIGEGLKKVYTDYISGMSPDDKREGSGTVFEMQSHQHTKVRLMVEILETFMAFFRMVIDQKLNDQQRRDMYNTLVNLMRCSSQSIASAYSLQSEMLRIAVYGGQSASSTLYFFQEDLFPSSTILNCLLSSGIRINRQDIAGNTALHYSIECPSPNADIVKQLLEAGAHVDAYNRHGVAPYYVINQVFPHLCPFQYLTLKCFCSKAIVSLGIPYKGQVPATLEDFIVLHGMGKKEQGLGKSSSTGDLQNDARCESVDIN